MRLGLVVLCVGAVAFLLRVFSAWVRESISPARQTAKAYGLRLGLPVKRGKLIEMTPDAFMRRFPAGAGRKVALGILAILGLAKIEAINTIFDKF
jgi:hypothetical protein